MNTIQNLNTLNEPINKTRGQGIEESLSFKVTTQQVQRFKITVELLCDEKKRLLLICGKVEIVTIYSSTRDPWGQNGHFGW